MTSQQTQAPKIYLAAMYGLMPRMVEVKRILEAEGAEVTAQWVLGLEDQSAAAGAKMDLADIDNSDIVLVFTNPAKTMFSGGGRFVEMGYAIAAKKKVIVIGECENVFCNIVPRFSSLSAFMQSEFFK